MSGHTARTDDVVVHWLPLTAGPGRYPATEEEVVRSARYRQPEDQARSLLAAGLLRAVLAEDMGVDALQIRIDRRCLTCGQPHGRPMVRGGPHISVTHAGGWVGVALSRHAPVGLDVEPASAQIPDSAFAPGELRDEPVALWVSKEAALKATGDGLSLDPATVLLAHDRSRVLTWSTMTAIARVDPDHAHVASVCVLAGRLGVESRLWT